MFFPLLAILSLSDTSLRYKDIQTSDQPCFSISITHMSHSKFERLDGGEGNILTAILETHHSHAARNGVLVYIPSNAIYFESNIHD
jgi:hypothetical protein